ncbi:MAG: hypothetical protein Q4C33_03040 [bacterium]|nr:hypothetical protein [bacterium]
MLVPKIKFKKLPLEENINIILNAYFTSDNKILDIHNLLSQYFPEFKNIDINLSKKEKSTIISNIITNYYTDNIENIDRAIEKYTKQWEFYNDIYFTKLVNYLNITKQTDIKEINCYIGMLPFFPRDLNSKSFIINPHLNELQLTQTCAHETLHFLWFHKWKELYPQTSKEEYESPHLPWIYSEMVTDPILNSSDFQKIFKFHEKAYPFLYTMIDGKKTLMEKITEIYNSNFSIEDKIKKGYIYLKSNISNKKEK